MTVVRAKELGLHNTITGYTYLEGENNMVEHHVDQHDTLQQLAIGAFGGSTSV